MADWKREDDARIAAAVEAQRQERIKIEQEQQRIQAEKARLEREAEAKEQAAVKKALEATTAASREKALKAVEAAQTLRAAAEAIPEPSTIPFIAQEPVPVAVVAKGTKPTRTPIIDKTDVTKLPAIYLTVNEALLKKHILDGAVTIDTPGVTFHIEHGIAATGR